MRQCVGLLLTAAVCWAGLARCGDGVTAGGGAAAANVIKTAGGRPGHSQSPHSLLGQTSNLDIYG